MLLSGGGGVTVTTVGDRCAAAIAAARWMLLHCFVTKTITIYDGTKGVQIF